MATVEKTKELVKTQNGNLVNIEKMLEASAANLGKALPQHMNKERMTRIVISLLKTSPTLQECTPISFVAAVFQMAQLGLEPFDGQAYIIPYNNKGVKEAQFQIGYKGYVSLFYRHQSSMTLNWGIVKDNDKFTFDKGQNKLSHQINLRKPRGEAYAYWVKASMHNGAEVFEVMSKLEIIDHAKKHSKTYDRAKGEFYPGTPWRSDFDSMALKTVLIQLMKLLPKSVEIQRAISMDETTKTRLDADMSQVPDETDWIPPETKAEIPTEPEKEEK